MMRFKAKLQGLGVFALLYLGVWVFGEHGYTYSVNPARKIFVSEAEEIRTQWACDDDDEGPLWDNGDNKDPVCHIPVRQCPALWFPFVTQAPCPYKDPLGGSYTDDDLFMLKQMRQRKQ
jgi:hypothetical protein